MKLKQHWKLMLLATTASAVFFTSCDDNEKPKTVPVVVTGIVTDITTTSGKISAQITDNGNAGITVSGFVYSSVIEQPTIADDKIELTTTEGEFSSLIEDLNSGTTYYVRAYATNSIGTGYGEVVNFTTNNSTPTATNVSISGTAEVNKKLTANYTFSDSEGDQEAGSIYKWYVANDGTGLGEAIIAGATGLTYTIQDSDHGKYIRFSVTPKAATGNSIGSEIKSAWIGAVGEATSVTFQYNDQEVTYGIITSTVTGKKWLDRNLGAPNVPTAVDNYQNYGDLFQWGRLPDGHQLIVHNGVNTTDFSAVNASTTDLSVTDNPGHALFIKAATSPSDWRNPKNSDLWQGVNGANNPCPAGWRVPTREEWAAENITSLADGYTKLKLTNTGFRSAADAFLSTTAGGFYQTATVDPALDVNRSVRIRYDANGYNAAVGNRAGAYACRCIKN